MNPPVHHTLTIFYPLKDSKTSLLKKPCFLIYNLFNPFRSTFFFVFPDTLNFQCLVIVIFQFIVLYCILIFLHIKKNVNYIKDTRTSQANGILVSLYLTQLMKIFSWIECFILFVLYSFCGVLELTCGIFSQTEVIYLISRRFLGKRLQLISEQFAYLIKRCTIK